MWVNTSLFKNVMNHLSLDSEASMRHGTGRLPAPLSEMSEVAGSSSVKCPANVTRTPYASGQITDAQEGNGKNRPQRTGFFAESWVLTQSGYQMISALQPGDLLLTRDRGFQPVGAVKRLKQENGAFDLACLGANSLAPGVPTRDVYLSKNHGVAFPNGQARSDLYACSDLSNNIIRMPRNIVVRIFMEQHELIQIDGLWVETSLRPIVRKKLAERDSSFSAVGASQEAYSVGTKDTGERGSPLVI